MVRVMIAAPTPALRAGLRALLTNQQIAVAGESGSLAMPSAIPPDADVIIIGDEALLADAAQALAGEPRYGALLLTDNPASVAALRHLPLTAWGALSHDTGAEELAAAVQAIANDLVVIAPALATSLMSGMPLAISDPAAEQLTMRERDVLELVSQGLSNKQIARQLQISEHTVKFHLSSLFAKLGVSSRTEAVNRGARQGLITL